MGITGEIPICDRLSRARSDGESLFFLLCSKELTFSDQSKRLEEICTEDWEGLYVNKQASFSDIYPVNVMLNNAIQPCEKERNLPYFTHCLAK